jgi:hypothetical protein
MRSGFLEFIIIIIIIIYLFYQVDFFKSTFAFKLNRLTLINIVNNEVIINVNMPSHVSSPNQVNTIYLPKIKKKNNNKICIFGGFFEVLTFNLLIQIKIRPSLKDHHMFIYEVDQTSTFSVCTFHVSLSLPSSFSFVSSVSV